MSYELYWRNDPDTGRDIRVNAATEAFLKAHPEILDGGRDAFAALVFTANRAAESEGSCFCASTDDMEAFCSEMRHQLGNAFAAAWERGLSRARLRPKYLLNVTSRLSDTMHNASSSAPVVIDESNMDDALSTVLQENWVEYRWSRFLRFLESGARQGGGVVVRPGM
jgi:hypothetical protein